MAKKAFDSIMAGLSDAVAYAKDDKSRGKAHVVEVPTVDVAAARKKLGLTQEGFSSVFRVSVGTVRNWEQKRRRPEGPAKVLLAMIERDPEAVLRTLHGL
ncbi:MAG: helix-turn-helix domain-containing protein [Alphaproteobacteria bacterium]